MIILLLIIFILLTILILKKNTIKFLLSILLNFIVLISTFYLIGINLNYFIITIIASILMSYISIFYINKKTVASKSSYISTIMVLLILLILVNIVTNIISAGGFSYESFEEINMYSYDIGINFNKLINSLIIIAIIGISIDISIDITTSLYEIYKTNQKINKKKLFKSGIIIGKDLLSTSINTIFFTILGEYITLLFYFKTANYNFIDIINTKVFLEEFLKLIFSIISCILIIPLSTLITINKIKKEKKHV